MTYIGLNPNLTYDGNGNVINSVLAATGVNGLAVATVATNFIFSTNNSTTAQLATNATFNGVIESALSQPAISMLMTSDQTMVINVRQFIDLAGTSAVPVTTFTVPANQQFSRSLVLNGNYVQISVTNQGNATTTTFKFDTAYGTIGAVDSQGNMPVVGYLTGQTKGDFDSVALLDGVVSGDLALHTKSINNPTQDINGNLILSDASTTGRFTGIVGQAIIIDTQGYQTLQITTNSTFAATGGVQFSNDGVIFSSNATGVIVAGFFSTVLSASTNTSVPCLGRYAKIVATTAGSLTYYLRNIQAQQANTNISAINGAAVNSTVAQLGVNLVNIGGAINASQAGTLALGSTVSNNGLTMLTLIAPTVVSASVVKTSPGKIYQLSVGNPSGVPVYLKVYNATSVTLGATVPILNFLVPGGTTGGTFNVDINDVGLYFNVGIAVAVTGGQPLVDSTALGTSCVINMAYI
jgi:hypothetical protein